MLGLGRGPLRALLPLLPLLPLFLLAAAAAAGPAAAARLPGPGRRPGAEELVARMTLEEKLSLLGGWLADPNHPYPRNYTGQTAGVPRLGIAPIVLNDGPQGFNTGGHLYARLPAEPERKTGSEADPDLPRDRRLSPAGSSTAWPCALAVASTFDVGLARRWGEAMAAEFRGKGADALLGPGVNVLRVPWNGRSFEYLSGEDPFLGRSMAGAVVAGIEHGGVIATVKHYIGNTQERKRLTVDEVIDDQTLREVYLVPFQAAVAAGAGSVMCAYNRINGPWSCGSNATLSALLRAEVGFQGFVMSDWGATHATAALSAGLDMEMPHAAYYNVTNVRAALAAGTVTLGQIDASARRVLGTVMAKREAREAFTEPPGAVDANVTSAAHSQLARELAAAACVLLENRAVGPHRRPVLPLAPDARIGVFGARAVDSIAIGEGSGAVAPPYVISYFDGIKAAAAGAEFVRDPAAAAAFDVAVVVVGVVSGEGADRANLTLPEADLAAVAAVLAHQPNVVVVVHAPGPVLLPFRDEVAGLVFTMFGGQEAGNGAADVLFGAVNPRGRLPFTIPASEDEVRAGFAPAAYPGVNGTVEYPERLAVGYRRYRKAGSTPPAYWFGFGRAYGTAFGYHRLRMTGATVSVDVQNLGDRRAVAVPQLYLTFPAAAHPEQPPEQLRAFWNVELDPMETRTVNKTLGREELQVWDAAKGAWALPAEVVLEVRGSAGAGAASASGTFAVEGWLPPVS